MGVLVVYRTGFVRSGVLSLIGKSAQFVVRGETDEAPLARELFVRHKPDLALVGLRLCGADVDQGIPEPQSSRGNYFFFPNTRTHSLLNASPGRVRGHI